MANVKANSNFHTATKTSVFDSKMSDGRFKEYRKRWHEYPSKFIVGDFPIHLDIESTSFCNLRCPFCASTYDSWGPGKKGFMDFGLYRRIIDEGASCGLFSIKLSVRGEPLLHKMLPEMISYAKEKGIIDIYFNTNGTLLDEKISKKLIDSGLDRISVSFEGLTKDVYEKYRVGANFEQVVENVKTLKRLRDMSGGSTPQIRVQTVLFPELESSFKDYVAFWGAIADEVSYLDARNEARGEESGGHNEVSAEKCSGWACPFLWQRVTILWDGDTLPCLMHGVKDFAGMAIGNAGRDSIKSMWRAEACGRYRSLHQMGQSHELEACRRCSYREMEIKKIK